MYGDPKEDGLLFVGNSAAVDGSKTETAARIATAALLEVTREVVVERILRSKSTANTGNTGTFDSAFVLGKPPTHHALGNSVFARYPTCLRKGQDNEHSPIGFCHLNGIATAVGALLNGEITSTDPTSAISKFPPLTRILILDFDVHHGNANEDSFWNDKRVFTISLHERGIWPGIENGRHPSEEVGGINCKFPESADVEGYTGDKELAPNSVLNIPIASPSRSSGHSSDKTYVEKMEEEVFPRILEFQPEAVFIAAGFDAMKADGYASMRLTENWYGWCL